MSEHLDLDALADLLDGEGNGEAHLSSCAHCAARLGELADSEAAVTASLDSVSAHSPNAPTLPPALADRIAAALAAEPPLAPAASPVTPADVVAGAGAGPAAVPSAAAFPSAATVTPLPARSERSTRRLRGHPAWLPSVAAGAVLLLGAGIGYTVLRDGGSSSETTAAADRESGASLRSNDSGVDYADAAAANAALPAVLTGRATAGRMADTRGADAAAAPAPTPLVPARPAPTGPAPAAGATPQELAVEGDPLARLRQPEALASCLVALLPPEEPDLRPIALDYARYAGAPALAVVLPDPDPTKVSIFVVGPDCAATTDDLKFFTRLVRP